MAVRWGRAEAVLALMAVAWPSAVFLFLAVGGSAVEVAARVVGSASLILSFFVVAALAASRRGAGDVFGFAAAWNRLSLPRGHEDQRGEEKPEARHAEAHEGPEVEGFVRHPPRADERGGGEQDQQGGKGPLHAALRVAAPSFARDASVVQRERADDGR